MNWNGRPFDDVRRELAATADAGEGDSVRVDTSRQNRTGVPEFILGGAKSTHDLYRGLLRLTQVTGRATATRCSPEQTAELQEHFAATDFTVELHPEARAITIARQDAPRPNTGGRVAVITAGTSDIAAAAEAAIVARELGCTVYEVRDVGVAGLHRLVRPLEQLAEAQVHVIVVVAGMDGALPSVVAGLVPVPVIGLPTSVGYGFGGGGVGALTTMLQSCAPGLVVVNIDNGVGAGSAAARIANLATQT